MVRSYPPIVVHSVISLVAALLVLLLNKGGYLISGLHFKGLTTLQFVSIICTGIAISVGKNTFKLFQQTKELQVKLNLAEIYATEEAEAHGQEIKYFTQQDSINKARIESLVEENKKFEFEISQFKKKVNSLKGLLSIKMEHFLGEIAKKDGVIKGLNETINLHRKRYAAKIDEFEVLKEEYSQKLEIAESSNAEESEELKELKKDIAAKFKIIVNLKKEAFETNQLLKKIQKESDNYRTDNEMQGHRIKCLLKLNDAHIEKNNELELKLKEAVIKSLELEVKIKHLEEIKNQYSSSVWSSVTGSYLGSPPLTPSTPGRHHTRGLFY